MAKDKVNGTDYVKVATYLFFDEYRKEREGDVPGVMYNKFITLLYRELKPEKDIGLPHCWYRWGDTVVARCVPYVTWERRGHGRTVVGWNGAAPIFDHEDGVVPLIMKNIAEFMARHSGGEAHGTAKDEVYEGAPFKFQNEYRKLRESLESLSKNDLIGNRAEHVGGLFESAMREFPKKEFKQIADEREKFETVFRMGLANNASSADMSDFAELFWHFFCHHLRMNERCHDNVTAETLRTWAEDIPWEAVRMRHFLQDFAEKLSRKATGDPTIISLREDWKRRMDRADALTESILGDPAIERTG
ncbi:MAG: hypothetical protein FWH47_07570 [Methanomassiliicoccaceae archaeon]|nr:hypothetical protein [Methanomassiliicoccaceae archaeon]